MLYAVFFHIHPAVGQKAYAFGFKQGTAKFCMFPAGNGAVRLYNALPGDIVRALAHGPAHLPRRAIQQRVEDALSEEILSGKITIGDTVKMEVIDDKLAFTRVDIQN